MASHGFTNMPMPRVNYSGFDQWNSQANGVYIKWKPILKGAQIPKQATNHSGGYDLFLPEDVHLKAMECFYEKEDGEGNELVSCH